MHTPWIGFPAVIVVTTAFVATTFVGTTIVAPTVVATGS
jgi:hypothetical protein